MKIDVSVVIGTIYLIIGFVWLIYLGTQFEKNRNNKFEHNSFHLKIITSFGIYILYIFSFLYIHYMLIKFINSNGTTGNQSKYLFFQTLVLGMQILMSWITYYADKILGKIKFFEFMREEMFYIFFGITFVLLSGITYKIERGESSFIEMYILFIIIYPLRVFYKWWKST